MVELAEARHPLEQPSLRHSGTPHSVWQRVWWRLKHPARRLRLTREGKFFVAITFLVGFAAINTGNNLLYLLWGLFLSLILVSGVLSELGLRGLTAIRRLPTRAQVARAHLVEVEVFNHKRWMPSYAIQVEDLRAGQPADKRCFFLKVSPRSAQVAVYRRIPGRRGEDRHIGFRIATRFPFGLFEKSRELACDDTLIVYPAVDPLGLPADANGGRLAGSTSLASGSGDELLGVRPMRDGDDPRDIYWRKSTIPSHLILRVRARETARQADLFLERTAPSLPPQPAWADAFEVRIRDVASRCVAHLRRGDRVVLRTDVGERVATDPGLGPDQLLRFLALTEAAVAFKEHPTSDSP
jgi:uncharacterized protein (DUF58 family)